MRSLLDELADVIEIDILVARAIATRWITRIALAVDDDRARHALDRIELRDAAVRIEGDGKVTGMVFERPPAAFTTFRGPVRTTPISVKPIFLYFLYIASNSGIS